MKKEKLLTDLFPLSATFSLAVSSIISKGEAKKCLLMEANLLLRTLMRGSNFFLPVRTPVSYLTVVVLFRIVKPSLSRDN